MVTHGTLGFISILGILSLSGKSCYICMTLAGNEIDISVNIISFTPLWTSWLFRRCQTPAYLLWDT